MKMSSFFTNRTSTEKEDKVPHNILKNQNTHQNVKNARAVRKVSADGEIRAVREMRAERLFRPQSLVFSLRPSNTGNIFVQLVAQHCCKALLPLLPPPQATCQTPGTSCLRGL